MSTGLHATGLTVAESEESFTRTESVARWLRKGRAAYEAERESLLFGFLHFDRCKVFQSGRKVLDERGQGFFFLSEIVGFISLFFRCCCAMLCFLIHTASISK